MSAGPGVDVDAEQRVAVVTGAGRGLGRDIATHLAARGVRVVLAGRTHDQLASTRDAIAEAGGLAESVTADVADEASVQALFDAATEAYGRLDVLVNNAGVTAHVPLAEMSLEEWERVQAINVRGVFLCSRAASRHFSAAGSGRAVNVASVFGLLGRPGFTAYGASKGAVVNFTRAAAAEWARFGAQINAVAPGYFATDINAELRDDSASMAKVLRRIPAHRMGRPDELANIVTYLSLDAPDFLTGQTIAVDGGESSV